jgi:hypothetical protein
MKKYLLAAVAGMSFISCAALADMPGKHPAYMHALSDLSAAKWMLENSPGNAAVSGNEDMAIHEINAAYGNIKKAAIYDGKDMNFHPAPDTPNDYRGRLHKAVDLLNKVRSDVAREEDDPAAQGFQANALGHIDAAIQAAKHAVYEAERNE